MTVALTMQLMAFCVQGLVKFAVGFLVPYESRMRRIAAFYERDGRIIGIYDTVTLIIMLVLVMLLFLTDMRYLSFITGLVVGMLTIQLFFHRFARPLPAEKALDVPTPLRGLMSYAIQAAPGLAWREIMFMAALFGWALHMLIAEGLLGYSKGGRCRDEDDPAARRMALVIQVIAGALHAEPRASDGFDRHGGSAHFDVCCAVPTEEVEQQFAGRSGDAHNWLHSPRSNYLGVPVRGWRCGRVLTAGAGVGCRGRSSRRRRGSCCPRRRCGEVNLAGVCRRARCRRSRTRTRRPGRGPARRR